MLPELDTTKFKLEKPVPEIELYRRLTNLVYELSEMFLEVDKRLLPAPGPKEEENKTQQVNNTYAQNDNSSFYSAGSNLHIGDQSYEFPTYELIKQNIFNSEPAVYNHYNTDLGDGGDIDLSQELTFENNVTFDGGDVTLGGSGDFNITNGDINFAGTNGITWADLLMYLSGLDLGGASTLNIDGSVNVTNTLNVENELTINGQSVQPLPDRPDGYTGDLVLILNSHDRLDWATVEDYEC